MHDLKHEKEASFALSSDAERCTAGFGALLTHVGLPRSAVTELRLRFNNPKRPYHNGAHVGLLRLRHLLHGGDTGDRDFALALLFRDAVPGDSPIGSRDASAALLGELVPGRSQWAQAAIRASGDPFGYDGADGRIHRIIDLSLSRLAEDRVLHARNLVTMRRQYASMTEPGWQAMRKAFLDRAAASEKLFHTRLGHIYEARAQENLDAERAAADLRATG